MVTLSSAPPLGEIVWQIGQFASGIPPGIPTWLQSTVRFEGRKLDTPCARVENATQANSVNIPATSFGFGWKHWPEEFVSLFNGFRTCPSLRAASRSTLELS